MSRRALTAASLLLAFGFAVSGCGRDPGPKPVGAGSQPTTQTQDAAVEKLADRAFEVWLQLWVDDRARANLPTGAPDLTESTVQATAHRAREILQELDAIPVSSLSDDARLTYGVIREAADIAVGAAAFFDIHFAVAPNQSSFHFLAYVDELSRQSVADEAGRTAYLTLVGYYGELARQHLERLKQQQARGSRMSKYLVDRTVRMLTSLRKSLRADLSVERVLKAAPAADRAAFQRQIDAAVHDSVEPAFDALIAFLRGDYRASAPDGIGLAQYSRGKDYYRYLIRRNTSMQMEAGDIHELGKRRVAELEADILSRAAKLGYRGTEVRGFFDFLKADPRFTAKGVEDWQREYTDDLAVMQALLPRAFAKVPAAGYKLVPMRESEQGLAYGYYAAPTKTQPEGIFYFSGSDPSGPSLLGTRSLAYHEVIPGHHLQFARIVETPSLDKLRSIYWVGGYTEGWAEYAASLGEELGAYPEPYEAIGHRIWELLMSARLVADTGINELGWSLAQAEAFWRANSNLTAPEIDSEIQRSAAIPGQLLVYRLGYEKMHELRERTQGALGERFDLKAYNELLLKDGALPLPVLEQKVVEYIERNGAAPGTTQESASHDATG